jgi:hypothetical protein
MIFLLGDNIAADAAEGFAGDAEIGAELDEGDALEEDGVILCDVFVSFGGSVDLEEVVVFFLADGELDHVMRESAGQVDVPRQGIDEGFVELSDEAGFAGFDEVNGRQAVQEAFQIGGVLFFECEMDVDLAIVLFVVEAEVAAFEIVDVFADFAFSQENLAFRDLPNGGVGADCIEKGGALGHLGSKHRRHLIEKFQATNSVELVRKASGVLTA